MALYFLNPVEETISSSGIDTFRANLPGKLHIVNDNL
jgi:hypothetical protein